MCGNEIECSSTVFVIVELVYKAVFKKSSLTQKINWWEQEKIKTHLSGSVEI